jgi:hypothetical protein
MASFCAGCGFPLAAGAGFCQNCGMRQQGAASPAPPPMQPVAMAPPPPARSGSGLKIVLVLVAFMAVAGIAAIGGLWYIGHRVKAAVVEKAKAYGVDLPKDIPVSTESHRAVRLPKPCDLLSKEDAATMLGEPIERTQTSEEGCLYFGPAGLALKLAQEHTQSTIKKAEAPGAAVPAGEMATAVDNLLNAAAAGSTGQTGGEQPLLMLMIDPDGKAQLAAMNIAKGIFGGIAKGSGADFSMGTEISGLGDRAIRLPKLGLNVLKGEVLIRIIPGSVPDADTKTINIARTVLTKI